MFRFSQLPNSEAFDDLFQDLWGSYVDARITYANGDEEYFYPGAYERPGLDGVYEFLKDTLEPGESFTLTIGEYDPTP